MMPLRAENMPTRSYRLMLLAAMLLAVVLFSVLRSTAQSPATSSTPPVFEVASIRMAGSGGHSIEDLQKGIGMFSMSPFPTNLFTAKNASLSLLIQIAYSIDAQRQISTQPGWMESQQYDISAKVEGDQQLTAKQMRPLLQHLLEQRFHLQTHRETRLTSGYALVVAKGGAKLQPNKEERKSYLQIFPNGLQAMHSTTNDLTGALTVAIHQPVIDKTGLTGIYDIKLSYAPDNDSNSSLPSIFTALQEQLGLKLEPQKVPVEMLVIDHVDRIPSEN
jgi:uncharacterized protein (TIGR03435 family)